MSIAKPIKKRVTVENGKFVRFFHDFQTRISPLPHAFKQRYIDDSEAEKAQDFENAISFSANSLGEKIFAKNRIFDPFFMRFFWKQPIV